MQRFYLLPILLVTASLLGCGESKPDKVLVLCGNSFQMPMEKLIKMYKDETDQEVEASFAGSEDHLPHVKKKMAGDVYVTHDPYMKYTKDAGALDREVHVGYLAPVVVVKKGNLEKPITSFDDLARDGVRVVLTDPDYSTCGVMVMDLLDTDKKKHLKEKILANTGNAQVRSHTQAVTQISMGQRDAGIVWNGVATTWKDKVDIVPTPYEYDKQINVAVMGLSYTKQPEKVKQFLDFVEKHGPAVFKEFGYVKTTEEEKPEK